jgi:hypothetical protein
VTAWCLVAVDRVRPSYALELDMRYSHSRYTAVGSFDASSLGAVASVRIMPF